MKKNKKRFNWWNEIPPAPADIDKEYYENLTEIEEELKEEDES